MSLKSPSRSRTRRAPRNAEASLPVALQRDHLTFGDIFSISFQRTLRVSEHGLNALPPGFGCFSLRSVPQLASRASADMLRRGGVALPIYQCEALWMHFDAEVPVAVQIGAGMRCAVTGREFVHELRRRPQNYVTAMDQPWLDGFKTASGEVRQFVAAPLGAGATVEEQLSQKPAVGGIQVQVWELTPDALQRWKQQHRDRWDDKMSFYGSATAMICASPAMGLGAGGRIRQEIYRDTFSAQDWRPRPSARVWVHLVAAGQWYALTGEPAPSTPVNVDQYISAGLPWFDYFDAELQDVDATRELAEVKTVGALLHGGLEHAGATPVPPGDGRVIAYGDPRPEQVMPGDWS